MESELLLKSLRTAKQVSVLKVSHDLASFDNLLWPNPIELADSVIDKCLLIQGLLSFSDFGRKCVILTLLPPFNCLVLFSCLEWSEDRKKIGD